jgi:hypothetical protein
VNTKARSPHATRRQAQRWDAHVEAYKARGLCVGCAGQAAYGHQLGFNVIKPPCEECQPLVDTFRGEPLANGWRTIEGATIADNWLSAIEAKRVSHRVLSVARLIAEHSDEYGLACISRGFIEKAAHAGTCVDAARGLKVLLNSGWLLTHANADVSTHTPRTFLLAIPERDSANADILH